MNFWDRLDWLIKERGLLRKDVTSQVGLGPSAMSVWKSRKTYPDVDVAVAIARVLGVTVEYLIEGPTDAPARLASSPGEGQGFTLTIPRENELLHAITEKLMTCDHEQLAKVKAMLEVMLD